MAFGLILVCMITRFSIDEALLMRRLHVPVLFASRVSVAPTRPPQRHLRGLRSLRSAWSLPPLTPSAPHSPPTLRPLFSRPLSDHDSSPPAASNLPPNASVITDKQLIKESNIAFQNILTLVKANKLKEAIICYHDMKFAQTPSRHYFTLSLLIGACQKAEHLPLAVDLFNELSKFHMIPNEAAYLALIRCFADSGDNASAIEVVNKMDGLGIEIKLRCCHPIIESLCRENKREGIIKAFDFIDFVKKKNVRIQADQLLLLIEVIRKGNLHADTELIHRFENLLTECSLWLFGMTRSEIVKFVATMRGIAGSDVAEEGTFVEPDYVGRDTGLLMHKYERSGILEPKLSPNMHISAMLSDLEKFVPGNKSIETFSIVETAGSSRMALPAAVVNISHGSCRCPNCGAFFQRTSLSTEERSLVREGLLGIAQSTSAAQLKNLKDFERWLQSQDEFEYIVDAANVAYSRQNFEQGRFSFKQIELVVDRIRFEHGVKRVLVVMPTGYLRRVIRNSVRKNRDNRLLLTTEDDQRIIEKFRSENMIYEVPGGANDDWYWIYATVYEGRKTHASVISNDLMRDHRLAFLEPRPFLRWRNSHITLFDLDYAAEGGFGKLKIPSVYFIEPAPFSREIQRAENGRFHVPSLESDSWLCADFHGMKLEQNKSL